MRKLTSLHALQYQKVSPNNNAKCFCFLPARKPVVALILFFSQWDSIEVHCFAIKNSVRFLQLEEPPPGLSPPPVGGLGSNHRGKQLRLAAVASHTSHEWWGRISLYSKDDQPGNNSEPIEHVHCGINGSWFILQSIWLASWSCKCVHAYAIVRRRTCVQALHRGQGRSRLLVFFLLLFLLDYLDRRIDLRCGDECTLFQICQSLTTQTHNHPRKYRGASRTKKRTGAPSG